MKCCHLCVPVGTAGPVTGLVPLPTFSPLWLHLPWGATFLAGGVQALG